MSPHLPHPADREDAPGRGAQSGGRSGVQNWEAGKTGHPGLDGVSPRPERAAQTPPVPAQTAARRVRWLRGGLLGIIGFLLSPLSWWNDLFVNIPLALGFAWLVALFWPAAFEAAFIAGYWLTNVIGLVLLTRGAKELLSGRPSPYSRRELLKDLLVAAAYTAVIVVLIKLRVLQPLQDYGH